jgi:hypothetical protein
MIVLSNRVAVITPYYKENNEYLRICHESVLLQAPHADHFFVADGHPNPLIEDWSCKHIILSSSHGDCGNTPRGIGALLALSEGYKFITFLDADNWYHENHIENLLALYDKMKFPICCSFRTYHSLNGSPLNIQETDEDNLTHVDTNCIMLHESAARKIATLWTLMPKKISPVGDRIIIAASKYFNLQLCSNKIRSVAYRTQWTSHYLAACAEPPENSKGPEFIALAYRYLFSREGIDECQRLMGFWPGTYCPRTD